MNEAREIRCGKLAPPGGNGGGPDQAAVSLWPPRLRQLWCEGTTRVDLGRSIDKAAWKDFVAAAEDVFTRTGGPALWQEAQEYLDWRQDCWRDENLAHVIVLQLPSANDVRIRFTRHADGWHKDGWGPDSRKGWAVAPRDAQHPSDLVLCETLAEALALATRGEVPRSAEEAVIISLRRFVRSERRKAA